MSRQAFFALSAFSAVLVLGTSAQAQFQQQQGFGGTTGGMGAGSTGMGIGATSMGGGTSSGGSSGGMFGGRTPTGVTSASAAGSRGAMGGSSMGQMGSATGQGANGSNPGATIQGNERFTREGRQPGAFVGADRGDTTSLLSQMQGDLGAQGLQGNQAGQFGNQNQQNQFNNQNNNNNNRPRVRTGLRVAPELRMEVASKATSPVSVARVQTRLSKTPQFQRLGSVQLAVNGRTAILRGTVGSDHARALAERVAMLEPGISAVQNDLVVSAPDSEPSK